MPSETLAQKLLDAQVAFHIERLTGADAAIVLTSLADDLFDATQDHQLADLIEPAVIKNVVRRALATVPASAGVSGIVEMAVEVLKDGPGTRFALGELVHRDRVEPLIDAVLALTPVLERALDRLTASPMVGTVASRFMGRVATEVMATNQAIADKIPGLGSLTRLGTSAATVVGGAANKQFEGLIGKGSSFAVRGLNRVLIDTAKDPATREAILQVWELLAIEPVGGLRDHLTDEQISGVVDAGHAMAVDTLPKEQVAALTDKVVDAFFEWFGGYTPVEMLEQLQISRADLMSDLNKFAPTVLAVLKESGDLERLLRSHLEPFYYSAEVSAMLKDA